MTLPTIPAAYWRPEVSLSEVFYLRTDGTWWSSLTGKMVPLDKMPTDLTFLSNYK